MTVQLKISGFVDYSEKENRLFSDWKKKLEDTYRLFGFMGFNPRPVESIAALQLKGGIAHQIYTLGRLQDGSMTDLGLPFDRTVPLAIYVAAHRQELVYPFKRFDISHSFRGERPQAGRARAFIQADIDVIDENLNFISEAECLLVLVTALKKLEIPAFQVYVNHITIPKTLIRQMGISEELMPDALRIVDKMDKIGLSAVAEELKALCPSVELSYLELLSFKGPLSEFMTKASEEVRSIPGFAALQELLDILKQHAAEESLFLFCPGMVRGLDYYTGTVFETFLKDYPGFGSIASGGRYGKLIDSIVNKNTGLEGFGISIGLTRLFDVLKKEKLLPELSPPPSSVLIAYRDPALQKAALTAATALRQQGISVDLYSGKSNIGKQITYADKKNIPYVFMLMGESYVIKNLKTGTQTEDISSLDVAVKTMAEHLS